MKTPNVGRIRFGGSLKDIDPADPEIPSLLDEGLTRFTKECPEFDLRGFGANLFWIKTEQKPKLFTASVLVLDAPKTTPDHYKDQMQTALPSFSISQFSYEPHLITALEEDELIHYRGEIVDYLKRQEMTGFSQIAHDLKIDLETCNMLLLYLLRAGKIEKKGKDWNTAVFIVVR